MFYPDNDDASSISSRMSGNKRKPKFSKEQLEAQRVWKENRLASGVYTFEVSFTTANTATLVRKSHETEWQLFTGPKKKVIAEGNK